MLKRFLIIGCVLAVLAVAAPCHAVIVFQKGRDEPIRGYLVEENSLRIVVNEVLPNGQLRKWDLSQVQVEDIVRAVSADDLAALRSNKPEGYRRYAEDLAAKTEDPDARAVAIRLYVIAAHLSPDELGRSCLLGAAALARSSAEERAFHAMAFLLDPDHDSTLLKTPKATPKDPTAITDEDRSQLRTAIRMLRNGKLTEAKRMLDRESIGRAKAFYSHIATDEDYVAATDAKGRLSPKLLRKFVTLELALAGGSSSENSDEPKQATPWSRTIARKSTQPIKPLALAGITEFDPRACHFVDGKWVQP